MAHHSRGLSLLPVFMVLLAALLPARQAMATVVTGQVTDLLGQGLINVDLDFIDRKTGTNLFLLDDNTDALGFYSVSVPAGDYDVRFTPPLGALLVGVEIRVKPAGSSMVLNQVLQAGVAVSGRVLGPSLAPAVPLDLDFIDVVTGLIFTPRDNTDPTGNFTVIVPEATYNIQFEPGLGLPLAPREMVGVVVGASGLNLGDVVLDPGFHLQGEVLDPGGLAVGGAGIRLLDPATGLRIFANNNLTTPAGLYDLMAAPRAYTVEVVPPAGTPLLARQVAGVTVSADLILPPIQLDPGVLAAGSVTGPAGAGVRQVNLDFIDVLSGLKRFTVFDETDVSGNYQVAVAPALYDITFRPKPSSGLAPQRLPNVLIQGGVLLPAVSLSPGFMVSGVVTDLGGLPQVGVDLDFISQATGLEIFTPGDNTLLGGLFAVTVEAGSYDVRFTPAAGSGLGAALVAGVMIGSDLDMGTILLPAASQAGASTISPVAGTAAGGTLVTVNGSGFLPGVKVDVGGLPLSGITMLDPFTIQGVTRAQPAGQALVQVTNPGAATVLVEGGFTYLPETPDPVLVLSRTGPLGTDIQLDWTSTGRDRYAIFRTADPSQLSGLDRLDVLGQTTFRDDGAVLLPGFSFYLVQ
ncbi:MAG: IPT/TIG domain-containing protein [Acidobacteriota bacterium]